MKLKFSTLFILIFSLQLLAFSQPTNSNKDKKNELGTQAWNIDFILATDFPVADLAKRFGTSYRIGLGVKLKTEKNWIYGAKVEFITGNKMKDDSLLINMQASVGGVITQDGNVYNVGMFQRGYVLGLQFGKILPFWQANKNSGPLLLSSLGFIQYKINLFDRDNAFPQLRDEYKKGYDRLTNGIYVENLFGYAYYSKNKLTNFYAGLNVLWGFTEGRRSYLYDLQRPDTGNRNDVMLGFKLGWVLPIYKKNTEETYY